MITDLTVFNQTNQVPLGSLDRGDIFWHGGKVWVKSGNDNDGAVKYGPRYWCQELAGEGKLKPLSAELHVTPVSSVSATV